jgi:hypothetical protein
VRREDVDDLVERSVPTFLVEHRSARRHRAPPAVGVRLPPGEHHPLQRRAASRSSGPDDQRVFSVGNVDPAPLAVAEPDTDGQERVVALSLARQRRTYGDETR